MKTITSILIGLAAVPTLAWAQSSPLDQQPANDPLSAQVTLPYSELKHILQLANRPEPEKAPAPPVGAALKSALFVVSAQAEQGPLRADAQFKVINLSGEWEWTPLISGVQVDAISPQEAMVVKRGDVLGLLHREAGVHEVSLSLSGQSLQFSPVDASSCQLQLSQAPKGQHWQVDGHSRRLTDLRYALDPGEVKISMQGTVTEVESKWTLRSELALEVKDSGIQAIGRIALHTSEGTGQTARIKLPSEATDIQLKGADLAEWNLSHDSEGQWLDTRWKTARILNRSLELIYTLPTPTAEKTLRITPPSLAEGDSMAFVALAAAEGIEVAHAKEDEQANPGNLPPWIRALTHSAEMVSQSGSGPFEFSLRYLPRAKTADATIRIAHFDMQVVADGSLLCTADFEILHREWTQWEFSLPEKGMLLSCQRNGTSADPIISSQQALSLQLPSRPDGGDNISRVRLVYTAKIGAMDPVEGALTLKLPSTPLFVQQTDWILRIPDAYRARAIEGNVAIKPTKEASEGIALTKSFNQGDAVVAQLHYRKKGLEE